MKIYTLLVRSIDWELSSILLILTGYVLFCLSLTLGFNYTISPVYVAILMSIGIILILLGGVIERLQLYYY